LKDNDDSDRKVLDLEIELYKREVRRCSVRLDLENFIRERG
jgi:hypothetical protein